MTIALLLLVGAGEALFTLSLRLLRAALELFVLVFILVELGALRGGALRRNADLRCGFEAVAAATTASATPAAAFAAFARFVFTDDDRVFLLLAFDLGNERRGLRLLLPR